MKDVFNASNAPSYSAFGYESVNLPNYRLYSSAGNQGGASARPCRRARSPGRRSP